jgi:hypothetical protein
MRVRTGEFAFLRLLLGPMINFTDSVHVPGTFTPRVHAHAGHTQVGVPDAEERQVISPRSSGIHLPVLLRAIACRVLPKRDDNEEVPLLR